MSDGVRFSALDALVLVGYLGATTALGLWLGRKQSSARDYFVADRNIPWWAVMFSIVASETSALTFISIPGLAYLGDFGFLQVCLGYIVGRVAIAAVLLPRFFQGEVVTAYSILDQRFGPTARRMTSLVFIVTRGLADSVRVFATAIPIALIMGPVLPRDLLMPVAILVLGLLTVVYTYQGGMRAVVWTELLQAGIYVTAGISAVVLLGQSVTGGWDAILAQAGAADKVRMLDWRVDITRPHTMLSGVLGGAFIALGSHGVDQTMVQRLLSSRSLRDAQKAIIGSGILVFLQMALFLLVGIGLWAFFGGQAFDATDAIFPTFIIQEMPSGLLGLVVAAVVAATMSTHSGAINSLAATTTHDIYLPLTGRSADAPETFRFGKRAALFWGTFLTVGALFFPEGRTPVVVIALSIASFTQGALVGAFMLGIFVHRARERHAIIGMSVGLLTMACIVFAKLIVTAVPSLEPALGRFGAIAWPWYVLIGTGVTVGTGWLSAVIAPGPSAAPRA